MTTQIPWGWIIGGIAAGAAFGLTVPVATQPRARKNPVDLKMLKDEYGIDGSGKTKSQILQEVETKLKEESIKARTFYDPTALASRTKGDLNRLKDAIVLADKAVTDANSILKDAKSERNKVKEDTTLSDDEKKKRLAEFTKLIKEAGLIHVEKQAAAKTARHALLQKEKAILAKEVPKSVPKIKSLEHIVYQLWEDEDEEEAADQREREIMKKALQRSKEKRPSLYGSGTKVKRRSRNN